MICRCRARSSSLEQLRDARHPLPFVARNLQQGRVRAGDLGHHGIAQEAHHLPGKVSGTVAFADQPVDQPQHRLRSNPAATACITSSSTPEGAAPTSCRT